MIEIREERPADIAAIREVNAHAFGSLLSTLRLQASEHLWDRLRVADSASPRAAT